MKPGAKCAKNFISAGIFLLPFVVSVIFLAENISQRPAVLGDITSNVTVFTVCGDNIKQGTEECDGIDLNGSTCVSKGYLGGTLSCNGNCTFNTSLCTIPGGGICGNNVKETGEECDGSDLTGATCISRGFISGTLACYPNCTFNESQCVNPAQVTPTVGVSVNASHIPNASLNPTSVQGTSLPGSTGTAEITAFPTGAQNFPQLTVTPVITPTGGSFLDNLFSQGLLTCSLVFIFGFSPLALVSYLILKKKKNIS